MALLVAGGPFRRVKHPGRGGRPWTRKAGQALGLDNAGEIFRAGASAKAGEKLARS